jgi:hypothetical protein
MKRYRKHFGIFRNKEVTDEIRMLDPVKDHHRIVFLMTCYEFPWDMVRALEIALMRTFCSPSISKLLDRTGEFRKHGQKRYDDTALLIAEYTQYGYDSERGRKAIEHMNKIHGFYKIDNEDYLYVLSTFVFLPIYWIDAFGWRKTTENERQAVFHFCREVGKRMNIEDIPDTLKELKDFSEDYERETFIYSKSNKAIADATIEIVKGWLPFFAKPFVFPIMKCFLDDRMLTAFGYTHSPRWLKMLVLFIMKVRALVLGKITFKKYPTLFTTEKNRSYPDGYQIEQLGPQQIVKNW